MSLKQQIDGDIKQAMLSKNKEALEALRSIKSMILLAETEKGGTDDLANDVENKLLMKAAKQRKESAEIFQKEGREDLASSELFQLNIINGYLPKQLSEEELATELKKIIQQVGAQGPKDMGKVMGTATKALAGKVDGRAISDMVKKLPGRLSKIDIVLAILFLAGGFLGYRKGFLMELFFLCSLVLGVLVAFRLMGAGVDYLHREFNADTTFLPYISFLIIFIAVVVGVTVAGKLIKASIDTTFLGRMDAAAGAVLGVMKFMFGVSVLIWLFTSLHVNLPAQWTKDSWLYPFTAGFAPMIAGFFGSFLPVFKGIFKQF